MVRVEGLRVCLDVSNLELIWHPMGPGRAVLLCGGHAEEAAVGRQSRATESVRCWQLSFHRAH